MQLQLSIKTNKIFVNIRHVACVCEASTDCCSLFVQTMEPVDQLLQCVDPTKDRELWVRENKTGEIRPVDVEI